MKTKRLIALITVFVMLFTTVISLGGCSDATTDDGVYTIGICQLSQHDALDAATKGFKDVLTEKLGDKVKFDEQNASGDSNACATIVNSFVSSNVDLIMANATPALQSAAAATTEIPILATSITEYGVALEIADFNGVVGGNISGTSDLAPLDKQADMILELFPETKTVGLLYCSAEPNSAYQVKVVKEYLEDKNITCNDYPFSDLNDIAAVTTTAAGACDVIYVPTDNTAASAKGIIDGICRPAKVPVIAGEEGICAGCGVATLSISYYELGRKTGEMAYQILAEGADISTMEIQYDENYVSKYNKEIADELSVTIPDTYKAIETAAE